MNLFEIQQELIAGARAEDWYRIPIAGPWFHYRWQFGSGRRGEFSYVIGEHTEHAVCRVEPSLTMSWGLPVHDRTDERRHDWAVDFVTREVHEFWVDFFWNNALIDRVELGRVDGGHGILPMPGYGRKVTDFAAAVAELIYEVEGPGSDAPPSAYIEQLGFVRLPDVDRRPSP